MKNKLSNLFNLINNFEQWKKQNKVDNVFLLVESRYQEILQNQNKILNEIEKLKKQI
jgi:hypothetical protein